MPKDQNPHLQGDHICPIRGLLLFCHTRAFLCKKKYFPPFPFAERLAFCIYFENQPPKIPKVTATATFKDNYSINALSFPADSHRFCRFFAEFFDFSLPCFFVFLLTFSCLFGIIKQLINHLILNIYRGVAQLVAR